MEKKPIDLDSVIRGIVRVVYKNFTLSFSSLSKL